MAPSREHNLTFLRGAGYRHDLVGGWDLIADATGQWPSQSGFLIFKAAKIIAVIERDEHLCRGIEGAYAVEGNRIKITGLSVDTAPEQGALDELEFEIAGDVLTVKWPPHGQRCQPPNQVDKFRRRALFDHGLILPPTAIYEGDVANADTTRQ